MAKPISRRAQNAAGARKRGGGTKDRRRPKTRAARKVTQPDGCWAANQCPATWEPSVDLPSFQISFELEYETDGRVMLEIPELPGAQAYGANVGQALDAALSVGRAVLIEHLEGLLPKRKPLRLRPGGFYRARDGEIWCCYRIDLDTPHHKQALCVRVYGRDPRPRCGTFFIDGRYDGTGKHAFTLIEEVPPP